MSVYKVINAVQADLCKEGITKSSKNTGQGYMFRGIDAVYNAVSPLLAKHGLCILPRMLSRSVTEQLSAKGGVLFYVVVDAEFDFVCTEDGSKHTVKTFGEAMDSGDKATNKAMSAAYKYAAFQTFAIPTEGDNDADSSTHTILHAPKNFESEMIPKGTITPTTGIWESLTHETQEYLTGISITVKALLKDGDVQSAFECIQGEGLANDQKIGLTTLLDSKERSALTKYRESLKGVK